MAGGLLNLIAVGDQNVIVNGNPSKTFFTSTYKTHTNFGMQKFRLDYEGQKVPHLTEETKYTFKVKRYADLLMETYLSINLPNIYSPIYPPDEALGTGGQWVPYEFKWIKNLGSHMIERVRFTIGGQVIQEFTGQYLYNMVQRDFEASKKDLYDKMTGHVPELNEPANAYERLNVYPNAYYTDSPTGPEPSIRSRSLYIPLNIWFTMASKMAFPLAALHYNEFHIEVDIKPVKDLYVIRHIPTTDDPGSYYHQPNYNVEREQLYRFLHPPPSVALEQTDFTDKRINWILTYI